MKEKISELICAGNLTSSNFENKTIKDHETEYSEAA